MMSLRCLARSVPRSTARLASFASRSTRQSMVPHTAWRSPVVLRESANFSTTRPRFDGANEELSEKLNSEIAIEQENQDEESGARRQLEEYIHRSEFQIDAPEGEEEVVLYRDYGDEKIRVVFSIADFNNQEQEVDSDDPAMYDDEEVPTEGQTGGANTKGSVNQGKTKGGNMKVAPEDEVAPADRDELRSNEDEPREPPSFAVRCQVHITRGAKGALTISCTAEDGSFTIDDVYYFPKADLAEAKTPELDYERRTLYMGPPFGQLDEELQDLLERYLDERGINTEMALFIPEYIDMKEQKEYIRWLGNMKSFVE